MLEYQRVPQEAAREVPGRKPPQTWPAAGVLEYRGVWMRYRDGLPPVLKVRGAARLASSCCCGCFHVPVEHAQREHTPVAQAVARECEAVASEI